MNSDVLKAGTTSVSSITYGYDADNNITSKNTTGVETLRQSGGLAPRALVGGIFSPSGNGLTIKVNSSIAGQGADLPCKSQLWRPLIRGLPQEFAESVMAGIVRKATLPPGVLVVDRAGHDPVESSPLAFELAAELMCEIMAAKVLGLDVKLAVRNAISTWP